MDESRAPPRLATDSVLPPESSRREHGTYHCMESTRQPCAPASTPRAADPWNRCHRWSSSPGHPVTDLYFSGVSRRESEQPPERWGAVSGPPKRPALPATFPHTARSRTLLHFGGGGTKHKLHAVLPDGSVTTITGSPLVLMCAAITPAIGLTAFLPGDCVSFTVVPDG